MRKRTKSCCCKDRSRQRHNDLCKFFWIVFQVKIPAYPAIWSLEVVHSRRFGPC